MQFYTILTHILLSMVSSSRILSNSVWPNEMQSLQDSSNLLSKSYRQLWGNYSTPPYDEAQWANTATLERPLGSSYFGGVTALSGEYMFVGASSSCGSQALSSRTQCSVYANTAASTGDNGLGVNGNGIGNGTVYVYKYIDPYLQWQLYQNLTVEGSYEFGYSIEVKGSIAVIGAPRTGSIINENNENDILQEPESSIGAVYIFQYDGVTWTLAQTLSQTSYNHSIANNLPVQNFGHSLSLSADASILVIGAPYKDRASTPGTALGASGTVWVYSYDTMSSSYILDQMIVPSSLMSWFGLDVAIGSTAITTYTGYNTLVISTLLGSGNAVYIYSRSSSNSNWILSSTLQVDSYSGYSLAFAGSTLLLTNYIDQSNTNNQGSLYTYTWDSTSNTFIQSQQFYNPQATMADGLGIGLAVGDENTFVAAASTDKATQLGATGLGLYVYSRPDSSSSFTQTHYIPVTTAYTYTSFVSMITTPSPQIVVGGSNLESVYKVRFYNFTRAPDPTSQPTLAPTTEPSQVPTETPTITPTQQPSEQPSEIPTSSPTVTHAPSSSPTSTPTSQPTTTKRPSVQPTIEPSQQPSETPTLSPTELPTLTPSSVPTYTNAPTTIAPTTVPTTLAPSTLAPTTLSPVPGLATISSLSSSSNTSKTNALIIGLVIGGVCSLLILLALLVLCARKKNEDASDDPYLVSGGDAAAAGAGAEDIDENEDFHNVMGNSGGGGGVGVGGGMETRDHREPSIISPVHTAAAASAGGSGGEGNDVYMDDDEEEDGEEEEEDNIDDYDLDQQTNKQ